MPRSISPTSSILWGAISSSRKKVLDSMSAAPHICGAPCCGRPALCEVQASMKIADDPPSTLTALDRPNSYIGRSVPRPNLQRLTQGRGQYVSDVSLPRMAHVAYVRSPHAHARI